MRLNWLGRAAMNNPARGRLQQEYVGKWFERLGGRVDAGRVLEVGCGQGAGIEVLRRRFGAESVVALDLDVRMIARARRRILFRPEYRAGLMIGDVTSLPAADETFDAVFDFSAIHLVPEWERALDEVARVLRRGGRYYFEWVTGKALRSLYGLVTEGFRR